MLFNSVLLYYLPALIVTLTFHEAAHALTAYWLGDPTAKQAGRVSLNPLRHLDPLGTLMLVFAGFGWGKPVPVNPRNFEHPGRDNALTAFSGPVANLLVAMVAAIVLVYAGPHLPDWGLFFFRALLDISIVLAIFNLLPFPPLDGSNIYGIFVPESKQWAYQAFIRKATPYALIVLLVDLFLSPYVFGYSLVMKLVGTVASFIKVALLSMV